MKTSGTKNRNMTLIWVVDGRKERKKKKLEVKLKEKKKEKRKERKEHARKEAREIFLEEMHQSYYWMKIEG